MLGRVACFYGENNIKNYLKWYGDFLIENFSPWPCNASKTIKRIPSENHFNRL